MEEPKKYLDSSIVPLIKAKVDEKQDKLVSGTNIKTVNNESILGEGDIELPAAQLYATTGQNTDGAMTQKAVTDSLEGISDDIQDVSDSLSKNVQLDLGVKEDTTSTVTLVKTSGAINSDETSTSDLALPVASATSAGVINPATYQAIEDAANQLEAINKGSVVIDNLPAEETQEQLTDAWKQETGLDELINNAKIYDKANGKVWTYYANTGEWESADITNPEVVEIDKFTNTKAGTIKGDASTEGKVFAEADGTGSVNGWDALVSRVADLEGNPYDLPTASDEVLGGIKLNSNGLLTGDVETTNDATALTYQFAKQNADGTLETATIVDVPVASAEKAGIITSTQYTKLTDLPENAIEAPVAEGTDGQVLKLKSENGELKTIWADETGSVTADDLETMRSELQAEIDDNAADISALEADKQDKLIGEGEGQNIKTINGETLLGSGDVELPAAQLYATTGQNEDGAMTQKAVTDALNTAVTNADNKYATKEALESVEGLGDTTVQLDTKLATDTSSTVTIIKTTAQLDDASNTTDTEIALPVASATTSGVLNPSTYQTIQDNATKLEVIGKGSVVVEDLPADATDEQITAAWKEASGLTDLINGASVYDETNGKIWTYYENAEAWKAADVKNPEAVQISNFTNEQSGVIKGADVDGKVFAEADGTGSVKGWDTVKSSIANNATQIESAQTIITSLQTDIEDIQTSVSGFETALDDKQNTLVASGEGQNIKTVNGNSLLGAGDVEIEVPQPLTEEEFNALWNA